MSVASRSGDEAKERIKRSLFAARSEDGEALESYILHVKITEDVYYPSTPAPPGSDPANRKVRYIVVAVRRSGRVLMHKARENSNGTFSVGKTWNLDELKKIEDGPGPQAEMGPAFTITMQKPYYWVADSRREKMNFVHGLVKVFRKYTGGKSPDMVGFNDDVGVSSATRQPKQQTLPTSALPPQSQQAPVRTQATAPLQPTQPLQSSRPPRPQVQIPVTSSRFYEEPAQLSATSATSVQPPPMSAKSELRAQFSPQPQQQDFSRAPQSPSASTIASVATSITRPYEVPPPRQQPPRQELGYVDSASTTSATSSILTPLGYVDSARTPSSQAAPARTPTSPNAPGPTTVREVNTTHPDYFNTRPLQPHAETQPLRPPAQSPEGRLQRLAQQPMMTPPVEVATPPAEQPEPPARQPPATAAPGRMLSETIRKISDHQARPPIDTAELAPAARPEAPWQLSARELRGFGPPTTAPLQAMKPMIDAAEPARETIPVVTQNDLPRQQSVPNIEEDRARPQVAPRAQTVYRDYAEADGQFGAYQLPQSAAQPQQQHRPMTDVVDRDMGESPGASSSRLAGATGTPQLPVTPRKLDDVREEEPEPEKLASPIVMPSPVKPLQSDNTFMPPVLVAEQPPQEERPFTPPPRKSSPMRSRSPNKRRNRSSVTSLASFQSRRRSYIQVSENNATDGLNEVEKVLEDFDWTALGNADRLEETLRDELAAIEAANNHAIVEGDERMSDLLAKIDKSVLECENMDAMLTLYAFELNTLADDIAYIESQSRGLQVFTANQRALQSELHNLLETIVIRPEQLESLQSASLESPQGLATVEKNLVPLYQALRTMSTQADAVKAGMGGMGAVQERRQDYVAASEEFLRRLTQFMIMKFQAGVITYVRPKDKSSRQRKPQLLSHDEAYTHLYRYAPLMLYAKEINAQRFADLQQHYVKPVKAAYSTDCAEFIDAYRTMTRKATQDENEMTFTGAREAAMQSTVATMRSATLKRSGTVARNLRAPIEEALGREKDRDQEGKVYAHEVIASMFDEIMPILIQEQNFLVKLFHLSSVSSDSYADYVEHQAGRELNLKDLNQLKSKDTDRTIARVLSDVMDQAFGFLRDDMRTFAEWCTNLDKIQCVGILKVLQLHLSRVMDTDHEFAIVFLMKLCERIEGILARFIQEQIRAIEETKVKGTKRKGVVLFFKVFPDFANRIETQLQGEGVHNLDIRLTVNDNYEKINKAMFESLKRIARELPTATGGPVDPEDKEQLNYAVTMVENMHHYVQAVDTRGIDILEDYKFNAQSSYKENLSLYIRSVTRRPLGILLNFVEGAESLIQANPAEDISARVAYSKSAIRKLLATYDAKEIRKGVDALYKRVDKHFGEDEEGSTQLFTLVWKAIQDEYFRITDRTTTLVARYRDPALQMGWGKGDISSAFSRKL
ncbi:hypothetical protein SAICODRAFT_7063 [Saitoella complicata NRRL Y-17804]|uniref:uncharacterized protein n=1 Tax=Saitoella complicata (strain BCRC 22490 / CBS 7301 / JCM 7358 / NBRC 10748 / NRRL Y-17804) TaxID=698492 RepID=UPI000867DCA2|nr:uncharacterized protein SAICODRAFT_7063 [Saitoella complicata NRRL Y-17804]ODQ53339.1 hypothetical protein SAICODRAFT_7063 [Saitoella complicata NRRL Y-17804]